MEQAEAKSAAKALYLQAAAMAGLEVSPMSPEKLAMIVTRGFAKVERKRRPEAVGNLLKLLAATLQSAQDKSATKLQEEDVKAGHNKVCPVYPFRKRIPL